MNRLAELVPSERVLVALEKLEAACAKLDALDERFSRMERAFNDLRAAGATQQPVKEFYTPVELAAILGKRPYTIREWCRLGRVKAQKSLAQRGGEQEWRISHGELMRYQNEGLLPLPRR